MRELETIQKREKLNKVVALDEKGNGGANHKYLIRSNECDYNGVPLLLSEIQFQNGARKEDNSIHGVLDSDLLEIVRDRLKGFQSGAYASDYNAHALLHIEEALHCMNQRVEDRINRDVLGRNEK